MTALLIPYTLGETESEAPKRRPPKYRENMQTLQRKAVPQPGFQPGFLP